MRVAVARREIGHERSANLSGVLVSFATGDAKRNASETWLVSKSIRRMVWFLRVIIVFAVCVIVCAFACLSAGSCCRYDPDWVLISSLPFSLSLSLTICCYTCLACIRLLARCFLFACLPMPVCVHTCGACGCACLRATLFLYTNSTNQPLRFFPDGNSKGDGQTWRAIQNQKQNTQHRTQHKPAHTSTT